MCTTSIAAAYVCAHFAQVVITWVVMSAVVLSYDGACIVLCSPSLQPSAFKGTLNGPYLVAMMMQQYPPWTAGMSVTAAQVITASVMWCALDCSRLPILSSSQVMGCVQSGSQVHMHGGISLIRGLCFDYKCILLL